MFHRSGVFFAIFLGMHNIGTPIQTITSEDSQALMVVLSDVLASWKISAFVLAFSVFCTFSFKLCGNNYMKKLSNNTLQHNLV